MKTSNIGGIYLARTLAAASVSYVNITYGTRFDTGGQTINTAYD